MGTSKQLKIKNLNSVKVILMLSIVFLHSMRIYGGGWGPCEPKTQAPYLGYIAEWLGSFSTAAFTLISGYLFCYIKYEKGGYKEYSSMILNKAKRLLIPYVFISLLYVVPIHICFFGTADVIDSFVLGKSPEHLWFLLMLFGVFAIFGIIADFVDRHPIWGSIIMCTFFIASMVLPNFYQIATALRYSSFFYIGFILYKKEQITDILDSVPSVVYIIVDFALFAVAVLIKGDNTILKLLNIGMTFLLNLFGAIAAFIVLQKVAAAYLSENRTLTFFAKHSMTIYLVHQPIIFIAIKYLNGAVPPFIMVITSFVLSLGLSTCFSLLMLKTTYTRFLIGSK